MSKNFFTCFIKKIMLTFNPVKDKIHFTSQRGPEQTFTHFVEYAQSSDFRDRIPDIISSRKNYLSEGVNGIVYSIPDNDNFVLKVLKTHDFRKTLGSGYELVEIEDPFLNLNVGQPIAKYGDDILVLVKQQGKEFGIPYLKKNKINLTNAYAYMSNLSKMAKVSQDGYNVFMDEVKQLKKLGFSLDIWNSNNILLNGDEINIVDIAKLTNIRQRFYSRLSKMAILRVLIDEVYLRSLFPLLTPKTKSRIGRNVKKISEKVGIAMEHSKLPQLNTFNKLIADLRDLVMPRRQPRIDMIVKELIKAASNPRFIRQF